MTALCEMPNEIGSSTCQRPARRVILIGSYPVAACMACADYVETEPVTRPGDLRKHRVQFFSCELRAARVKFKSRLWNEANIEKRRESSRRSKAKQRLLYGHEFDPARPRFLSLDVSRCNRSNLYNVIPSEEPNPLEVLMAQETYENY